jgi:asparagine synthase (glutamine-hydrolysing)
MRRALAGIVPGELLNRKRKAFVARAPMAAIATHWECLAEMSQHMVSSALGVIEQEALSEALEKARQGEEVPIVAVIRSFSVESWLRCLSRQKLLFSPLTVNHRRMLLSSFDHHARN